MARTDAPYRQTASRLVLSELAPGVMQSEIRAMTTECDRIGGVNLAQGVCDTPVPAPVEAEAHAAIRAGHNIYTRLDGITRLRNAISAKQKKDYGLDYDPETEVMVCCGASMSRRISLYNMAAKLHIPFIPFIVRLPSPWCDRIPYFRP